VLDQAKHACILALTNEPGKFRSRVGQEYVESEAMIVLTSQMRGPGIELQQSQLKSVEKDSMEKFYSFK
jgi:hypothetical protein